MKAKRNISALIIIVCFIISFLSCKKSDSVSGIEGLAFIEGSSSIVNYSPKGYFIHTKLPDSGIWQYMILKKSNRLIDFKLFFVDEGDKSSLLYDNLSLGEYQIEYISELRDTIKESLELRKSVELKLSNRLNKFYNEVNVKDLGIENLLQNDTLQLLYQNYGCFGGSETLIEFIFSNSDNIVLRKIDLSLTSIKEPKHEWMYVENKNLKENLNDFIFKAKSINKTDLDLCTSSMKYFFRIKNSRTISIINDESCMLMKEIEKILYPK
jgi:hypothetical protein